jgi:hypothetical protein
MHHQIRNQTTRPERPQLRAYNSAPKPSASSHSRRQ